MPASREPEAAPSRTSGRVACCWARARGGSPRGRNLPGVLTTKGAPLFQSKRTDSEGPTLSALGFSPGSPSASPKRGARSEFSVSEQRKAQRRGLARARRRRSRTPRRWGQDRGLRVWCGGPGGWGTPPGDLYKSSPPRLPTWRGRHVPRHRGHLLSACAMDRPTRIPGPVAAADGPACAWFSLQPGRKSELVCLRDCRGAEPKDVFTTQLPTTHVPVFGG